MITGVGIGISTKLDAFIAGKDAAKNARYRLGKQVPDIILAFISSIFDQEDTIKGICSVIDETPLVGCSTVCSITPLGASRNSVTVCAISCKDITFSQGIGINVSKNPRLAGRKAARQASDELKDIKRQLFIIFSDSMSGNITDVLRGAQEILGTSFPIIGGSSTDNLHFQNTYQYFDNNTYTDAAIGLLVNGNIKIGTGNAHGWQPIGKPHKITKASSNIIEEIDNRKAIQLYEEYIGKTSDELKIEGIAKIGTSYPLGIRIKEKTAYITRSPLKTDGSGSLMLNAEIPEREDINLMIGDKNLALESAKKACINALMGIGKSKIKFAIVFSDIGRFQLLGKNPQDEVEIIKDVLGKDVPFFGCYTCGEFAPIDTQEYKGQSYFHNQTISVTVVSE